MKLERIKGHISYYRSEYVIGTVALVAGIGIAAITTVIVRDTSSGSISRDVIVTAGRDAIVTRKKIVMKNVSYISSDRQGPPSWVVRCIETGAIFTSQRAAALAMNISESNISRHLNDALEHAQGFHFERICLAA